MIREQCPPGTHVWFRDGAFVRAGRVAAMSGPDVCIRAGMRLLLRVRKDVWATEAEALRAQTEQIAEQMATLEVARGNALAKLAEFADPKPHATVTYADGRIECVTRCQCPRCRAAADCQS